MEKLEIAFLCNVWNCVLQHFHKTNVAAGPVMQHLSYENAVDIMARMCGRPV